MTVTTLFFLRLWVHFFWVFSEDLDHPVVIFFENVYRNSAICASHREHLRVGLYDRTCKFRAKLHDVNPFIFMCNI
jgi:hypothetical protein